ncbi:MAG TPA: hypothetical protein DDW83_04465, partial [Peptococcaceae bacterium]|nr:hypothetical protein [Peptococcaceae bacterium]
MMLKHLPMEEARQAILNRIKPLESETLPSLEAVRHILGEDIIAPHDLPPYRQAAMDGFAVSFKEKQGQGEKFLIKKILEAGGVPDFNLEPGEAAGVLTGGLIPQGTESV